MECNKDEAKRAMEIAERKVTEKDYNGAKKFANKAQNLYPSLDGLKQLLMTIDVYISGEKKFSGETDWYGVLGVDPLADDEAIRKQYRKLALLLHPDKNKCKGAEGAFTLLSEAWSLLSDKVQRFEYNTKRHVSVFQRSSSATQQSGVPVPPKHQPASSNGAQYVKVQVPPKHPASNGSQKARVPPILKAKSKPPHARMDRSRVDSTASASASSSSQKESTTFWTKCERCRTQFEYLRIYLNQTLLCPNCRQGFVAAEKTPPESVVKPVNKQQRSSKNQGASKNSSPSPSGNYSFVWDSKPAAANSRDATNQVQQGLKRGFVESQEMDAAAKGFTNTDLGNFKKPKANKTYNFGPFAPHAKLSDHIHVGTGSTSGNPSNSARGNTETPNTIGSRHPHIQGMLLPRDITQALKKKAQLGVLKGISEIQEKDRAVEREKNSLEATSKMSNKGTKVEKNSGPVSHDPDEEEEDKKVKSIIVPDSDFHIFDLDRCESSFQEDQIWAAYDDDDGMPRFYARIQKVISVNPFKMKISWLNSKTCSEFSPLDWRGAGFAKTCGDFRIGRYETTDTLNAFSHKVEFSKAGRGIIQIFPKKGQVWALYRNWSPEWDKNTPDDVRHKYDMVEILDDYNEGLTVAHLVKAEGFGSVFRRSMDGSDVSRIPKEEMFRFSHQVPHVILSGEEGEDVPVGCLELDPAATPINGEGEAAAESSMGMNID